MGKEEQAGPAAADRQGNRESRTLCDKKRDSLLCCCCCLCRSVRTTAVPPHRAAPRYATTRVLCCCCSLVLSYTVAVAAPLFLIRYRERGTVFFSLDQLLLLLLDDLTRLWPGSGGGDSSPGFFDLFILLTQTVHFVLILASLSARRSLGNDYG